MKPPRAKPNHDARDVIVLGLAGAVTVLLLSHLVPVVAFFPGQALLPLEMSFRPQVKPSGTVVIAAIDDKTVDKMGTVPWTATQYAALISALGEYQPAVVGFCSILRPHEDYRASSFGGSDPKRRDDSFENNNAPLIEALRHQGRTYLESVFDITRQREDAVASAKTLTSEIVYRVLRLSPESHFAGTILGMALPIWTAKYYFGPPASVAAASLGTANDSPGFFGVPGSLPPMAIGTFAAIRVYDNYYMPGAVALASRYLGAPATLTLSGVMAREVKLGDVRIPLSENGFMWVNFRAPGAFPEFSASDIIERKVPVSALRGKIVLVGLTTEIPADASVPTYAGARYWVEIQANAVEDILLGRFLRTMDARELLALAVAELCGGLALMAWVVTRRKVSISSLIGALALYIAAYTAAWCGEFAFRGVVFPFATGAPYFLVVFAGAAFIVIRRRQRERKRLRAAFEHYLDPKIIDTVLNDPAGLELGGERRHLSVLFADIVNFTGKTEAASPDALVAMLNDFMSAMTGIATKKGAVIDKIVGDSIMAFWGAPARTENPARKAVDCALEMLAELMRLRREDPRFADFGMGLGVATGEAIVGNFGGAHRFDYSAIGDVVNLAARLEALTRQLKVNLLVDEQTYREADLACVARDLGRVRVKGKTQPVGVWEVVGRQGDGSNLDFYRRFSEAMALARKASAHSALEQLRQLVESKPEDVAARLYIELLGSEQHLSGSDLVLEFSGK